ncbi:MAG: hypothetical protein LUC43_00565 [Burkholderiales bacterium]|nr:hypothetical protein [Burkholderiales bacterium]
MATISPKYSSRTAGSSRERRIRQILAYFNFYWGGVRDITKAIELFVMFSRFKSSSPNSIPSIRELITAISQNVVRAYAHNL